MNQPPEPTPSRSPRRRRGLGRGLGALIAGSSAAPPEQASTLVAQAEAGGIRVLPVDAIQPNPHQPRSHFDPEALEELAASIAQHGIIQPLIVTRAQESTEGYWLVAGERRWRAARRAGLQEVPVIVREATPQQLLEWALVENLQRADLNPLEEAAAYQALMQEFGLTQAQVAERVGRSRSAVANTVRLLALPPRVQEALTQGTIHAGHARALLALPTPQAMEAALEQVLARDLTVRQTEALVRRWEQRQESAAEAEPPVDEPMDTYLRSLEDRFRERLGTKVRLERQPGGRGRLVIHFFSDEDLEHLIQELLGHEAL